MPKSIYIDTYDVLYLFYIYVYKLVKICSHMNKC